MKVQNMYYYFNHMQERNGCALWSDCHPPQWRQATNKFGPLFWLFLLPGRRFGYQETAIIVSYKRTFYYYMWFKFYESEKREKEMVNAKEKTTVARTEKTISWVQETGAPNDSENNCSKEQMLPRNFESSRKGLSLILDNRFSLVYLGFLWILA